MSDEEDVLQKVRTRFEDLCRALNMDEEASTEAWKSYENISRNFTLEVSPHTPGGTPGSVPSSHPAPRCHSSSQQGCLCPGALAGTGWSGTRPSTWKRFLLLSQFPHLNQPDQVCTQNQYWGTTRRV